MKDKPALWGTIALLAVVAGGYVAVRLAFPGQPEARFRSRLPDLSEGRWTVALQPCPTCEEQAASERQAEEVRRFCERLKLGRVLARRPKHLRPFGLVEGRGQATFYNRSDTLRLLLGYRAGGDTLCVRVAGEPEAYATGANVREAEALGSLLRRSANKPPR